MNTLDRPLLMLILLAGTVTTTRAQSETDFTEVAAAVGLSYNQHTAIPDNLLEPYYMAGGAAAVDINGDGWTDLFVTRVAEPPILFLNNRGRFEPVVATSLGIDIPTKSNGAAWGDVDNDGDQDLYITTIGETRNHLFINDGAGRFTEAAFARGVAAENRTPSPGLRHYGYGAAFGDYDRDGFLDLFTTSWLDRGTGATGHPGGIGNRLFHNLGSTQPGFFEDTTLAAGVRMNHLANRLGSFDTTFAFAPRFTDLDDDGYPDLAIAADFGTSRLFWNNRNGTFSDGTFAAGVGTDENGMGSAVGDYDGDGRLDWFVTSVYDEGPIAEGANWGGTGNRLFRNLGARRFADVTSLAGVRNGGWGWGTSFFDYDNDGDLDLVMANGMKVVRMTLEDKFNHDPIRLWRNNGNGLFTEVAASSGVLDTQSGKGLLVLDYDNDGDLDFFVVNNATTPSLFRNNKTAGTHHWLRVRLVGHRSNRDAIGARIKLNFTKASALPPQTREIDGGNNFLGQNERVAHFGLGADPRIEDLVIHWPSGIIQRIVAPSPDTLLTVQEESDYETWTKLTSINPTAASPTADPDGDRFANQTEYALGSNPSDPASTPAWQYSVTSESGIQKVRFMVPLSTSALEAQVHLETSPTLSGPWTSIVSSELPLGFQPIPSVLTAVIGDGASAQYVRVRSGLRGVVDGR